MSVRTKHASYLVAVGHKLVDHEVSAKGLATELYEAIQSTLKEVFEGSAFNKEEAVPAFEDAMEFAEAELLPSVQEKLGSKATMSVAVPRWRDYKSVILNGLKQGLNPADFETFKKFKDEKLGYTVNGVKVDKKKASDGATTSKEPASNGGDTSNANTIVSAATPDIASQLLDADRAALNAAIEKLTSLYEADPQSARDVVSKFDGACRVALSKMGGRFVNLNK